MNGISSRRQWAPNFTTDANPIVLLDAKIFSKPFLDKYNVPSAYPSVSLWLSAASEHTTERIPSVLWYEYHEQAMVEPGGKWLSG